MSQRVGLQEDVEDDVFGRCPFPRIHTHLLFTSSRHVLKQCCFAPVRADNRRGWAECNATGWAETAESNGGQHLARSEETGWHRVQKAETAKPSLFISLFCLGCHPRQASTWKEMSLKEYSVHKLFIFIQYAVIICHFIIEIKQFWIQFCLKGTAPEAPWFSIISHVYNSIYFFAYSKYYCT